MTLITPKERLFLHGSENQRGKLNLTDFAFTPHNPIVEPHSPAIAGAIVPPRDSRIPLSIGSRHFEINLNSSWHIFFCFRMATRRTSVGMGCNYYSNADFFHFHLLECWFYKFHFECRLFKSLTFRCWLFETFLILLSKR